jgi:tetratricopeptide (TPR) repeat protein
VNRKLVSAPLDIHSGWLPALCAIAAASVTIIALIISNARFWSVWIVVAGCLAGALPALVWRRSAPWPALKVAGLAASSSREFIVPVEPPASRLKFEGRSEELKAIHDRFKSAAQDRLAVVGITGPPGIGKTALAVQYAGLYRNFFPNGQLFTRMEHDAGSDPPVYEVLGQFLTALQGSDETIPLSLESRILRYRVLTARRRLLVILDNACHSDCVEQLLPNRRSCATIITSRATSEVLPADVLSAALSINLKPLSKDDGIRLLESEVGTSGVESSDKLAGTGHPLAIRLAAIALSRRPYWPLDQTPAREPDSDDEKAVSANLEMIYWLLTSEERKALRCIALLEKPVFAAWELAALLNVEEPDATKLADNLARVDLVRRTSGGPVGIVRFEVDEQILPYLRERIPAETLAEKRADGREALERAQAIRKQHETEILLELNWKVWERKEAGNLAAAFETVRSAVASAQENQQPGLEALALATMADLRLEIGNIPGARELAEAARSVDTDPGPVRALRCLGVLMCRQGELAAAQDFLDRALDEAHRAADPGEEIRVLIEQASTFAITAEKGKSLAAADRAINLCDRRDDCAGLLPSALYGKSRALLRCGNPREAMACLDLAASAVSCGQPLVRAWIDRLYSEVALTLNRPEAAIKASSAAIDGFGAISHRYGVACSRLALAAAYAVRGDDHLAEAVATVSDALETLQNCDDPYMERKAKRLLASLLDRRGHTVNDRADLEAAAELYEDLGDNARVRDLRDELASGRLASRLRQFRSDKPRQSVYEQRSAS